MSRRERTNGKKKGERQTAGREGFGFDVPAMLSNDGHADAQAESCAASRTFCGVKRIEDARQGLRADAHAVILHRDGHTVAVGSGTNMNAALVPDLADGL